MTRPFGSITERNGQWVVRWSVTDDNGKRQQPSRQFTSREEAEEFLAELRGQKPKNPRPFWMKSDREWLDAILPELQRLREENRRLQQDLHDARDMNLTRALLVYLGVKEQMQGSTRDPVLGAKQNKAKREHILTVLKNRAADPETEWMPSGALREEAELPKSTYKAIMDKLISENMVEYHRDTKRYRLTPDLRSKRENAANRNAEMKFLEAALADRARVPVDTLKARAVEEGLIWRTVHRAADDLCVTKKRQGFGGSTVWYLPTVEGNS